MDNRQKNLIVPLQEEALQEINSKQESNISYPQGQNLSNPTDKNLQEREQTLNELKKRDQKSGKGQQTTVFLGMGRLLTHGDIPQRFLIGSENIDLPNSELKNYQIEEEVNGRLKFTKDEEPFQEDNITNVTPGIRKISKKAYIGDESTTLVEASTQEYVVDILIPNSGADQIDNITTLISSVKVGYEDSILDENLLSREVKVFNIRLSLPDSGEIPDDNWVYGIYWIGSKPDPNWWNNNFSNRLLAIPIHIPGAGVTQVMKHESDNGGRTIGSGRGGRVLNIIDINTCWANNKKKWSLGIPLTEKSNQEDLYQPGRKVLSADVPTIKPQGSNIERFDAELSKRLNEYDIPRVVVEPDGGLNILTPDDGDIRMEDGKISVQVKEFEIRGERTEPTVMGQAGRNREKEVTPQGIIILPNTEYNYLESILRLYDYVRFGAKIVNAIDAMSTYLSTPAFTPLGDRININGLNLIKDNTQEPVDVWYVDGDTTTQPYYPVDIRNLYKDQALAKYNEREDILERYDTINSQTVDLVASQSRNAAVTTVTNIINNISGSNVQTNIRREAHIEYRNGEIFRVTGVDLDGGIKLLIEHKNPDGSSSWLDDDGNEYTPVIIPVGTI